VIDEVWDALEECFGPVRTRSERGRRNQAVRELREAGATVEEIRVTYRYCSAHYGTFSEMALCTNLSKATSQPRLATLHDIQEGLRDQPTGQ
jgi:hypothetical protein